jgi:type IV pilus assembly protein PilW
MRKSVQIPRPVLCAATRLSCSGFTIVEFLVAILLTSVIMGAIYGVYRIQTHSVKVQETRLEAQEYARAALDMMVREIRNAGYNPLGAISLPTAPGTNCGGVGIAAAPGVITANATTFSFSYDFQGIVGPPVAPDGNCDDTDEVITYQYQAPGPQNCASGFGDITRTANGATEPLTNCNVPTGSSNFSLSYFKQDGTPATGLADIQRVLIELTVQSMNTEAEFGGGQLNATMTSNADLRNRGLPP